MDIFKVEKEKIEIETMSPLIWAYIGDSIYETYIRTHLINTTNLKPNKLHIKAISYVKAKAQATILREVYPSLTEEEKEIVRRGRNAENHHIAKNANIEDYTYSTAFEGLIGYLFLTSQEKRLKEILKQCIKEEIE